MARQALRAYLSTIMDVALRVAIVVVVVLYIALNHIDPPGPRYDELALAC